LFEAVLRAGFDLAAGSMDAATTRAVSQRGLAALDAAMVARHGLDAELPEATRAALRQAMQDVHCGLLSGAMLDPMVRVQRSRDATLADRLHAGGEGAVLIAGTGHARVDYGVPSYLERAYGTRMRVLAFVEVDAHTAAPARDELAFDYVWFTPKASDHDHCAELRERFQHMHGDARSGPTSRRNRKGRHQ
jgi:uncharacterized iron-regulated protein